MTLTDRITALSPTARIVGGLAMFLAAMVAVALAWWFLTAPARHATERQQAKLNTGLADSRTASAKDAIQVTVDAAKRDAEADRLTRENADEIHQAPGADAPVDPRATDAGLRSLCRRPSYRCSIRCMQLLGPVEPSTACARS
jgi:hypothetical protein